MAFQAEGPECELPLGKWGVAHVGADSASVAGAQTAGTATWDEAGRGCRARTFDLTQCISAMLRIFTLSLKPRRGLWKGIATSAVMTGSVSGFGNPL